MGGLTVARLNEVLSYDPDTGLFRWVASRNGNAQCSQIAGGLNAEGYLCIMIDGRTYKAARLAFLAVLGRWPNRFVDHKNLNRADNRWRNLREATPFQNTGNCPLRRDSSTGRKGVHHHGERFRARIRVNGELKSLGLFDTADAASAAYEAAAKIAFGEFARAA